MVKLEGNIPWNGKKVKCPLGLPVLEVNPPWWVEREPGKLQCCSHLASTCNANASNLLKTINLQGMVTMGCALNLQEFEGEK
jgi:hypothetical protein